MCYQYIDERAQNQQIIEELFNYNVELRFLYFLELYSIAQQQH